MAVDPGIEVGLVEAPTLVKPNLSQPVADDLLFEAVPSEAAVRSGFIKSIYTLVNRVARQALPKAIQRERLQMLSD